MLEKIGQNLRERWYQFHNFSVHCNCKKGACHERMEIRAGEIYHDGVLIYGEQSDAMVGLVLQNQDGTLDYEHVLQVSRDEIWGLLARLVLWYLPGLYHIRMWRMQRQRRRDQLFQGWLRRNES